MAEGNDYWSEGEVSRDRLFNVTNSHGGGGWRAGFQLFRHRLYAGYCVREEEQPATKDGKIDCSI